MGRIVIAPRLIGTRLRRDALFRQLEYQNGFQ